MTPMIGRLTTSEKPLTKRFVAVFDPPKTSDFTSDLKITFFASVYVNTQSNMASQRQQESIIRTASSYTAS